MARGKPTDIDLFYTDARLMLITRMVGLGFSALLTGIETLIKFGIIRYDGYQDWAYWPTAIGFMTIGLLLFFWLPLTRNKNKVWLLGYTICGALLSAFVLGYNSNIIYLGWTTLIIAMGMMISARFAIYGYLGLAGSLTVWLLFVAEHQTVGLIVQNVISLGAVILLIVLMEGIWLLANSLIAQVGQSRDKESRQRRQLITLINDMLEGVIATDGQLRITNYNAAALDILDINGSLEKRSLASVFQPEDETGQPVDLKAYVTSLEKPVIRTDLKLHYTDGSTISLFLAIAPIKSGYGRQGQQGFTLILRDITREKSLEEERDEFISVVSHELRTPIAITEGEISNAQLIAEKTNAQDKIQTALEGAHSQVLFLADMINDLSTLSRAERGVLQLEPETIVVNDMLREISEDYRKDADKKGLKLVVKPADDRLALRSSKLYLREVLQNFVTNAIKYTEKGSVTISAETASNDQVLFLISDTGIGISKQDQKRVFDKFFRSEDYRTRQNSGTGLGLYVTMKLIKLLGAKVAVTSQLNKGSTFRVAVPSLAAEPEASQAK